MIARIESYIDGRTSEPSGGAYAEKIDPRNGRLLSLTAKSDVTDVDRAVDAACAALPAWRMRKPMDRGRVLMEIARGIRRNAARLGDLESADTGKPRREMPGLTDFVAQFFEFYGGLANAMDGDLVNVGPAYHSYVMREPFGVVGVILPWNAPLHQAARAIAPALAVGNTIIAKPSASTPSSLVELARITCEECDLPNGVFNVLVGDGAVIGPALATHRDVSKISFTGSLEAGRDLGKLAAERVLPLTLELGGKSADIVFDDANLDAAAVGATRAFTWNSGQWCAAGTRLLVQRSIHDEFVKRLLTCVAAVRVGPEDDADAGPITTHSQYRKILSYFERAGQCGLRPAIGGRALTEGRFEGGWYVEPTVYVDVSNNTPVAREEIFGPVLCVIPFEDEADAIRIANDSSYGLSAGIWSRDVGRVHRVARQLEAGRIVVNEYGGGFVQNPCGGYKLSGYGREQGIDALAHYTQIKSVIVKL
jgi:aldehyde dehydrogenase (NAD+)